MTKDLLYRKNNLHFIKILFSIRKLKKDFSQAQNNYYSDNLCKKTCLQMFTNVNVKKSLLRIFLFFFGRKNVKLYEEKGNF